MQGNNYRPILNNHEQELQSWITEENSLSTGSSQLFYEYAVLHFRLKALRKKRDSFRFQTIKSISYDNEAARILKEMNRIGSTINHVLDKEEGIIDDCLNNILNGNEE